MLHLLLDRNTVLLQPWLLKIQFNSWKIEKNGKRLLFKKIFVEFCFSVLWSVSFHLSACPFHNHIPIITIAARNVTTYLRMINIKIIHALKNSTSIVFDCLTFELSDCLTVYFATFSEHYELSLLNGGIYGAVMLYALHCGSSMHAGIIRDITQGTMIETCYTTYFFIKVIYQYF